MKELLLKLLKNKDTSAEIVSTLAEEYKPIFYSVLNEILKMLKDLADNKEYFEVEATMRRNMYDAYVGAGFTEIQALSLVKNGEISKPVGD